VYKTAETNLIGVLVMDATGKSLASYLSEKIWRPYGMERDAAWMVDQIGHEQGGCCLSVSLRDYARFGQFILDGAKIDGKSIVPDGWLDAATHKQAETGAPGAGYGYQWWTTDDGTFDARGIFGQTIHFDAKRKLVIVINSAWPVATGRAQSLARAQFLQTIAAAVDAEGERR
jgi:CubicO group peptidase (beta-lactamase class C family)